MLDNFVATRRRVYPRVFIGFPVLPGDYELILDSVRARIVHGTVDHLFPKCLVISPPRTRRELPSIRYRITPSPSGH